MRKSFINIMIIFTVVTILFMSFVIIYALYGSFMGGESIKSVSLSALFYLTIYGVCGYLILKTLNELKK